MAEKICVLDTTLRDGEQTPGVSLSPKEKLMIAKALDGLGVDELEAGSVATSEGERKAMRLIANEGLDAKVLSFARVMRKEIDTCLECDVDGLFLVAPTSEDHIKFKLKTTPDKLVGSVLDVADYAKSHGLFIDLCCEDGSRTKLDFLRELLEAAKAKIDRFTVADTVGAATPESMTGIFAGLSDLGVPLGVHCHDDLGLAVANTLAAVKAGAGTVDVTVNGLGERAGNAPLEEVVSALGVLYGYGTNIKPEHIYKVSRQVEELTGVAVQANKALVGKNAFTHESGIHVDGILKRPETYEFVKPSLVGRKRVFRFGKHVGSKGLKVILKRVKINVSEEQFKQVLREIKALGDKGKVVTDADLRAIIEQIKGEKKKRFIELGELMAISGNKIIPEATVSAKVAGKPAKATATGDGPVDAAINALEKIVGDVNVSLEEYHVDAITGGSDATVNVTVKLKGRGRVITASGSHTDIIMASVMAMVNGINYLLG